MALSAKVAHLRVVRQEQLVYYQREAIWRCIPPTLVPLPRLATHHRTATVRHDASRGLKRTAPGFSDGCRPATSATSLYLLAALLCALHQAAADASLDVLRRAGSYIDVREERWPGFALSSGSRELFTAYPRQSTDRLILYCRQGQIAHYTRQHNNNPLSTLERRGYDRHLSRLSGLHSTACPLPPSLPAVC